MSTTFNTPITFGRSGSAAAMDGIGIDFNDSGDRSWTTAPLVELEVRLPPAREDVTLDIDTGAYAREDAPSQQVFAYFGGAFIGFWRVHAFGRISARIPRTLFAGRPARLVFVLPNVVSPLALGLSEDRRELGLHLQAITFKLG
jgi:hypothetical protein